MSVHSCLKQREIGNSFLSPHYAPARFLASNDALLLMKRLWPLLWLKPSHERENIAKHSYADNKGVFGLKYSNDGKFLVAACENSRLVLIDPLTYKTICIKDGVHEKGCNTITFIDNRLFATCSDDKAISLWDVRNMKENVMHLKGHKSWVKNVEFHKPTGQLVSSGFDNQVLAWDFNQSSEGGCKSKKVLDCACLTRMRISSDGSSMYLTSSNSVDLIAFHNLDLDQLCENACEKTLNGIRQNSGLDLNKMIQMHDHFKLEGKIAQPFSQQNQVEMYYALYDKRHYNQLDSASCSTLDVHPDNSAIVMKYDFFPFDGTKCVSVHNMWSYYDGPYQGQNIWKTKDNDNGLNLQDAYLPMLRGLATNYVSDDAYADRGFIQEVAFSPCGLLIASPSGYGVQILAYDEQLTDYRTHMAARINSMQQQNDSNWVLPTCINFDPDPLHTVKFCFGHDSLVLCSCFSPTHMQLASGSMEGQIILHEVVL